VLTAPTKSFYHTLTLASIPHQSTSLLFTDWLSTYWAPSRVVLRPTVSPSVCLGTKHPSCAYGQIFVTVRQLRVCWCGGSLWWEDGPVVHNCWWSSPAQSISGRSPMGLATIFYCLRFETSLFVASYDSLGYGGGVRPSLHTGCPNSSRHWAPRSCCLVA
jgi:hypothetical protein